MCLRPLILGRPKTKTHRKIASWLPRCDSVPAGKAPSSLVRPSREAQVEGAMQAKALLPSNVSVPGRIRLGEDPNLRGRGTPAVCASSFSPSSLALQIRYHRTPPIRPLPPCSAARSLAGQPPAPSSPERSISPSRCVLRHPHCVGIMGWDGERGRAGGGGNMEREGKLPRVSSAPQPLQPGPLPLWADATLEPSAQLRCSKPPPRHHRRMQPH